MLSMLRVLLESSAREIHKVFEMRTQTVSELSEFVRQIEILGLISEPYLFRGQPIKGNLIPGIARRKNTTNTTVREKKYIEQIKLMGHSYLPGGDSTELDILVIAQHNGLETRLLDWTSNPLTALWFACADKKQGDVYVYALDAAKLLLEKVYQEDPFKQIKTRVFQPRLNNKNIIAQDGWFTLHKYTIKNKKFIPLEKNLEIKSNLTEFIIEESSREEMIYALDLHGVNYRTIFPDMRGLCRYLNWRY